MARPLPPESATFYHHYIKLTQGNSATEAVNNHSAQLLDFYTNLPENKADYAYAEGKWTLKELLQHLIDAERVFTYRTMRIARKDTTPLAGFDENTYTANSLANSRNFTSLKEEFAALRRSTDLFILSLNEEQLKGSGTASGNFITANALAFIIYGHLLHHVNIIKERYLQA